MCVREHVIQKLVDQNAFGICLQHTQLLVCFVCVCAKIQQQIYACIAVLSRTSNHTKFIH